MCRKSQKGLVLTNRESGFSLIELLISILVFMIFMAAVFGLLRIGSIQRTTLTSQTEVIKNARLSLNTIGRDALNAGFGYSRVGGHVPDNLTNTILNLPQDAGNEQDVLTAIIAGDQINPNNLLPAPELTDVVSFFSRDVGFNGGDTIRFIDAENNGGNGVKVTTAAGEAAAAQPFDLYLISNESKTVLALVTSVPNNSTIVFATGAADPLGINAPYSGAMEVRSRLRKCPSPPDPLVNDCFEYSQIVSAKRVNWVSYSVSPEGTLIRTIYGNNTGQPIGEQIRVQPIAYNVQNLQIRYLMVDGSVTDDPSNGGNDKDNLNNIVQIDVTVSTRVRVRENNVDLEKIINLNSTFSTKNLDYDIS